MKNSWLNINRKAQTPETLHYEKIWILLEDSAVEIPRQTKDFVKWICTVNSQSLSVKTCSISLPQDLFEKFLCNRKIHSNIYSFPKMRGFYMGFRPVYFMHTDY